MIEDNISLLIKDITKLKEELRGIKKDIKHEEKLDTPEYLQLKTAFDELKKQKKDLEEGWQQELTSSEFYQNLRELKLNKEESIATANNKVFDHIAKLPQKPFQMDVEMEEGLLKVHVVPEMRLYLNGREEKRRV